MLARRLPGKVKISIIGAGTVGPMIAIALKRADFDVCLYEQSEKFSDIGGGLNLAPNGLRFIQSLGLLDRVYEEGSPLRTGYMKSLAGNTLGKFEGAKLASTYGLCNTGIRRSRLVALAMDQVHREGIPVIMAKKLKSISQDENSIIAQFEDGSTATSDLLIGADGLKSRTRQTLFGEDTVSYTKVQCVLGITKHDSDMIHNHSDTIMWMGKGIQFGVYGIGHSEMVWFLGREEEFEAVKAKESWLSDDSSIMRKNVINLLETLKADPLCAKLVSKSNRIIRYGIYDRNPLPSWSNGRATLIGDAAHPMPPNLGQGANTALEDGGILCELLRLHDYKDAFKKYESLRMKRVYQMLDQSRQMSKVYYISNPILCQLRDWAIKYLFTVAGGPPVDEMYRYDYLKVVRKEPDQ